MQSDIEYMRMRIDQERAAAANAADPRVRNLHLELGAAYVFRLRETQAIARRSAFNPVDSHFLSGTLPEHADATAA